MDKPESTNKVHSGKLRAIPTWLVVVAIIVFFPIGLYLLWRQSRWSTGRKKLVTWMSSLAVVACFALIIIFAPPTVTVTSSLAPIKSGTYQLTGKVYPEGSKVTINGMQAQVNGDSFSNTVSLNEGDNNLRVVVINGSKRTQQTFTVHRYTRSEIAAQEKERAAKAATKAKAAADAAQKKATADAADRAKRQQDATAKAQADAAAAAQAAKNKATTDAAAQAKAAAAAVTVSQKNALSKAKSYLNYTAFSHDGLVEQLEYEQFPHDDAVYGADNVGANWNEQAAKKAKAYMAYSSFSRGSLIDQLEYDKFTPDQAIYGANAVGL